MNTKISWSDTNQIVELLIDNNAKFQEKEYVENISFMELKNSIRNLKNFFDDKSCNERKLEAIQQALINESS